jgi:hypothetical protein
MRTGKLGSTPETLVLDVPASRLDRVRTRKRLRPLLRRGR